MPAAASAAALAESTAAAAAWVNAAAPQQIRNLPLEIYPCEK